MKKIIALIIMSVLIFSVIAPVNADSKEESNSQDKRMYNFFLTDKEKQWLQANPVIYYSSYGNYMPFEVNKKNNSYSSINEEYLAEIGKLLGVEFVQKETSVDVTLNELEQAISINDINMVTNVRPNELSKSLTTLVEVYHMKEHIIYGGSSCEYVSGIMDLNGKRIAMLSNSWLKKYLDRYNLDVEYIEKNSIYDAVNAVVTGEADCIIEKFVVINEALIKTHHANYRMVGMLDIEDGIYMAINNYNQELISSFQRAVNFVDYSSFIVQKEVISTDKVNNNSQMIIVIVGIGIIVAIISAIAFLNNLKVTLRLQKEDLKEKERIYEEALVTLVDSLEEASMWNDIDTGTHTKRVQYYCEVLARNAGLDEEVVAIIKKYASLHDIGKMGVSTRILKKPGRLTNEEFEEIKQHVSIGAKLVERLLIPDIAKNIIKYHHENFDGSGYMEGLVGKEIPIEARIMAIADVYDALRMERVYKKALSHEETVEMIVADSGKKFDPDLVDIFMEKNEVFEWIFRINSVKDFDSLEMPV